MRKFFQFIGIFSLALGSFFYTNKIIDLTRNYDDLLAVINDVSLDYYVSSIDGEVLGLDFIPGINGREVDVEKSYNNMKGYGIFDKNKLLYKDIIPNNTLSDNIGKYIVSGNKNRNRVGLIFLLDLDFDVKNIVDLLSKKNVSASFFADSDWLVKNESMLKYLVNNNFVVGSLDYSNGSDTMIKNVTGKKYGYCFTREYDSSSLKSCKINYNYMIKPSIFFNGNLSSVKSSVENGSIIVINSFDVSKIGVLINYLKGKGYEIVNLDDLLLEYFE